MFNQSLSLFRLNITNLISALFLCFFFHRRLPWSKYYGRRMADIFDDLQKEYGPLFSLHYGTRRVVVAGDMATALETIKRKITRRPVEVLAQWISNK